MSVDKETILKEVQKKIDRLIDRRIKITEELERLKEVAEYLSESL